MKIKTPKLGLLAKPTKTPWHLRFAPGAILRQIGLAVLTLTMLFGFQNAEAQLPTYEIYGIDTTWLHEYVGGRWYETLTTKDQVFYPGGTISGRASYRSAAPIQDCPPSGLRAGVLVSAEYRLVS